jgi:CheY-like chemotaxis protein/anti-sigma regulatory factor (Ser/Thr protein kinase)
MPIILVADDSETDRKLIEGLLRPKLDWIVQFAENGSQAFDMIGEIFPDVVVTDLQMPEMDGIQLCAEAKVEYPDVPIVLITGKGSEELAVEALDAGAASYVPKSALANSLLETVEQVLSIAKHKRTKSQLMRYATNTRYQFNIKNDQSLVAPLIDFVSSAMERLQLGDKAEQRHVSVAIEEALLNAIYHGNLELDGPSVQDARRALHDGEIAEIVHERSQQSPYEERRVRIAFEVTRNRIDIVVRDDGKGFDNPSRFIEATDVEQLSGAGGRGLALIRNFMDEVEFSDTGNEIRMSLKLRSNTRRKAPVEA